MRGYLSQNRTSDVLAFHAEIECYYYLKLRNERKAKTVLFFHNDGIPMKMYAIYYPKLEGSWYMRLLLKRYQYTIENVDCCAFICEVGMKNINERYPLTIGKSSLIVNGIDDLKPEELQVASQLNAERNDKLVKLVCVGSVSVRKAQRIVIEALAALPVEVQRKYRLTIVGNGPDMAHCQMLVEKYHMKENVTFTGAIPNTEVYKQLAQSDIFVLMSNNEGLPISIIEGMRAGLAIISTNVSGIPELLRYGNGVVVEPTASDLKTVLEHLDDYDWSAMGLSSRKAFEQHFTFERMSKNYVEIMKSL